MNLPRSYTLECSTVFSSALLDVTQTPCASAGGKSDKKRIPMRKEQVKLYTPALLSLLSTISPFFIFLRKMPFVCIQWLEKFIGGASNESKILNSGNCHLKNIFGFESQKGCLWMCSLKWDSQEMVFCYWLGTTCTRIFGFSFPFRTW